MGYPPSGAANDTRRDGTPWYARVLRITNWRIVTQAFFFALFVFLLWTTWFSRLKGYPVSLFLEMDPLVGFATAISTHTVYRWLWRGMWILVPRSYPCNPRNPRSIIRLSDLRKSLDC